MSILILPAGTYTLPISLIYTGTTNYQDYSIQLDIPAIGDQKIYALPLKISSTSSAEISEIMSSTVVVVCVDDFSGWYTVDRLSKNGEGASSYPANPQDRRRYIRRTGDTSWETNELHIEYHYPDWPGWWNHERMYNRSLKK